MNQITEKNSSILQGALRSIATLEKTMMANATWLDLLADEDTIRDDVHSAEVDYSNADLLRQVEASLTIIFNDKHNNPAARILLCDNFRKQAACINHNLWRFTQNDLLSSEQHENLKNYLYKVIACHHLKTIDLVTRLIEQNVPLNRSRFFHNNVCREDRNPQWSHFLGKFKADLLCWFNGEDIIPFFKDSTEKDIRCFVIDFNLSEDTLLSDGLCDLLSFALNQDIEIEFDIKLFAFIPEHHAKLKIQKPSVAWNQQPRYMQFLPS